MIQQIPAAKLNHMSFPSDDMGATVAFFEKYLGFSVSMIARDTYAILKRPGMDVVIEHVSTTSSALQSRDESETRPPAFAGNVGQSGEVKWPSSFHIGLEFATRDDIVRVKDSLASDGFAAETGIFNNDRGSRFFLRAPGGVLIEFNTRSDASEAYRGTFDS